MEKRFRRLKRSEDKLLSAAGSVLSKQEYDDVFDRAKRFSYRFTSITLLGSILFFFLFFLPFGLHFIHQRNLPDWQAPLWILLFVTPLILVTAYVKRKEDYIKRKFFSKYMIARGLRPVRCLMCAYELRGVTADHCPECGEPLAPIHGQSTSL